MNIYIYNGFLQHFRSKTHIDMTETVNKKHVFELKVTGAGSNFDVDSINIGDELKLQMTGTGKNLLLI